MDKFFEIMKISFKQMFHYKWTFAMTVVTQPILLILNMILFKTIYAFNSTNDIKGYSLQQMVWYFTAYSIVQAFVFNSVASYISRGIIRGELVISLLRPYSYFRTSLATCVASRIIALIMDFLPSMVIFSLILFPTFLTPLSFIRFLPVVILGFLINFLFSYILGMTAISIKNNSSVLWMQYLLLYAAGGALIPLEFFPGWLNGILDFLPFKYIMYWPIQFFLNKESAQPPAVLLQVLGIQILWVVLLYIACKVLWRFLVKRLCDAGG